MRQVQRHTVEFKEQACKLVTEQQQTIAGTARELGVEESTLRYWLVKRGYRVSEHRSEALPSSDDPGVLRVKIHDLEARLRRAEMEKEILKKATAFFAGLPS